MLLLVDHCLCTADAHDCLEKVELLYDLAPTDDIPARMVLNAESLPELSGKLDWTRLTEDHFWHYSSLTDKSLSNSDIPDIDAILCGNINCKDQNRIVIYV